MKSLKSPALAKRTGPRRTNSASERSSNIKTGVQAGLHLLPLSDMTFAFHSGILLWPSRIDLRIRADHLRTFTVLTLSSAVGTILHAAARCLSCAGFDFATDGCRFRAARHCPRIRTRQD